LIASSNARLFQSRYGAEFFGEIRCVYNPAHHFCVTRFWDVGDENDFFWREGFAELGGERVF